MTQADGPDGDFDRRLAEAKAARGGNKKPSESGDKAEQGKLLGQGLRVGLDLVVPVAVGVGLGVAIDRQAGSAPAGLIVGLLLGIGAGAMGVYRAVKGMGYAVGYRRPTAKDEADEDKG